MKKYILNAFLLAALPFAAQAQNNLVVNYNPHWSLMAARQLPSKLGVGKEKAQLTIGNFYVYGGNSSIGYRNASDVTTEVINEEIGNLKPVNNIGAGGDLDAFAFSYRIDKDKAELFTLSVSVADRTAASLLYSENLMNLLWKGNKQYAGQWVDLGPLSANYFYQREYALGAAMPFRLSDKTTLRAGLRLKYLQGFAAVHMPKSDVAMFTEQEGRYIDFEVDYEIQTALHEDSEGNRSLQPFKKPPGTGFATDLGVTLGFGDRFGASLSVLDLGAISYKNQTTSYIANGLIRYEGAEVDNIFDEPEFNLDSVIVNKLEGKEVKGGSFSMPTSTRLVLQGEYHVPRERKNGDYYSRSIIFATYIQGLRNLPGATTKPFGSIGYTHSFSNVLNLGASVGYGGYNKLAVGSFISVRAGAVRLGFGSNNLTYLLAKNLGTGADFSFNFGMAF